MLEELSTDGFSQIQRHQPATGYVDHHVTEAWRDGSSAGEVNRPIHVGVLLQNNKES